MSDNIAEKGLWLPKGAAYGYTRPNVSQSVEDGKPIHFHRVTFRDAVTGRTQDVVISQMDGESQANVEDRLATAYENFILHVRQLPPLLQVTVEQRKEIGASIRQYREHMKKKRQSSNNRTLYKGAK